MMRKRKLISTAVAAAVCVMLLLAPAAMAKDKLPGKEGDMPQLMRVEAEQIETDALNFGSYFWQIFLGQSFLSKSILDGTTDNHGRHTFPVRPTGGETGCIMKTDRP